VEKNCFELKSAQRVLFDSNTCRNVWAGGQLGYAIVLTVRTAQSGDFAVVNDVTITNNLLVNVVAGFNTAAVDYQCGIAPYTNCKNAGSQDRWNISSNRITSLWNPATVGGTRNIFIAYGASKDNITNQNGVLRDIVFDNNVMPAGACWQSAYFSAGGNRTINPPTLYTNIWMDGNTLCAPPSGDNCNSRGCYGTTVGAFGTYVPTPSPWQSRYTGNNY
jgi:hypothetical protein